jgi:hypothetical protein
MFGKDRDDVRAEGMKYLTNDNIGKYLIYRDDNENAQHDENGGYIIKQIICSTKTTPCVIDLVDQENDVVLNDIDDDDQDIASNRKHKMCEYKISIKRPKTGGKKHVIPKKENKNN